MYVGACVGAYIHHAPMFLHAYFAICTDWILLHAGAFFVAVIHTISRDSSPARAKAIAYKRGCPLNKINRTPSSCIQEAVP